jgi:hypothetical protein
MTWGPINLSGLGNNLPPAGIYPASVTDFRLFEKPDVIWCAVDFTLSGTSASPRTMLHAIAATVDSPHASRVAEGLRFLHRLAQATSIAIDSVDYEELPRLFLGRHLELAVAHSTRDGVPELVIRSMRPPSPAE